jgi:hypothetical protein
MSYETSTAFDAGPPVVSGNPYLSWHVQDTLDHQITAGSFSIRHGGGRDVIDLSATREGGGAVFDWPTSKIGWMLPGERGVPPQRVWGATRSKLPTSPGEGWKKAFWAQIAILSMPSRCV